MRIAFDIGGTFTDAVFIDLDGTPRQMKVLSELDTVGADLVAIIDEVAPVADRHYIHATTICSNAVIEGTGAPVALITTFGFRDVLEMRAQRRPAIYDMGWDRLPPVVPRALRLEVRERLRSTGAIDTPLDLNDVAAAGQRVREAGVGAVAICLVNSYANSEHERAVAALIAERNPGIPVSVAGDEFPEIGEYDRTSTVAVNAALMPVVDEYLTRLEGQLGVERGSLPVMQSSGGLQSSKVLRRAPVRMIESGPAAGVLAAAWLARDLGLDRILSFDMGGTTAKVSLITDGEPAEKPSTEVGGGASLGVARMYGGQGHVVRVPTLDVVEVGAGGGSIARVDRGGAIRVGPRGAGAYPGPACYRRSGTEPTVTDANVAVGYMNPEAIAAGTIPIDHAAAERAISKRIAEPLGLSVEDAALAILRIAEATMSRALRAVSIERGIDPRDVTLVAFGGSGPLHAVRLAEGLGVDRVVVPVFPGVFSALGLLLAPYRQDAATSFVAPVATLDHDAFEDAYRALEESVLAMLETAQGPRPTKLVRTIDMQYRHQTAWLSLALPVGDTDLTDAFQARHEEEFGFVRDDQVDIVTLRVKAVATASDVRLQDLDPAQRPAASAPRSSRPAYFGEDFGWLDTPVLDRLEVAGGLAGPAILEEDGSCTLVPPGWTVAPDSAGSLALSRDLTAAR